MAQQNVTKIQLGNMDFLKYSEVMQAEWRQDNGKRFCYPVTLTDKGEIVPSILTLAETIDDLKTVDRSYLGELSNDQDSDKKIQNKIKLEYGMGEGKRIYLEYTRARYYFIDPVSKLVKKIWLPLLPSDVNASGYLKFVSQFTEAFLDIFTFTNLTLATNKNIIDANISGLGFELFEKLIGSTNTDKLTEAAIIAGLGADADRDKINEKLRDHEFAKTNAIIFDFWLRKTLNRYATNTKIIAKDLELRSTAGTQPQVSMETAEVSPVFPKRKEPKLSPITDSPRNNYGSYTLF